MNTTIERTFNSRRDAELAIERLVQEYGFERIDMFVSSSGDQNSAGDAPSGGDTATHLEPARNDAPLSERISVSVDVNDDVRAAIVTRVFDEIAPI
ncbi:hypothetical protein QUC32_27815 (plasmid) [Novosphingobium resinovorum]|uniref:hypothetical protein n=1 Tax=Novosphingobium TaxID=165696 RepID=UPI001B3C90D2|nr:MULTISPECIES: hypothetical protein [Novosphingobium]MBF7015501.1 hypothetical protein [Novosphingobium sp. HR1a]WJM30176.1 hypothetical protein QUC32_27815 [Novosphingobium resinovorum]